MEGGGVEEGQEKEKRSSPVRPNGTTHPIFLHLSDPMRMTQHALYSEPFSPNDSYRCRLHHVVTMILDLDDLFE